jgi:hypothetical protein
VLEGVDFLNINCLSTRREKAWCDRWYCQDFFFSLQRHIHSDGMKPGGSRKQERKSAKDSPMDKTDHTEVSEGRSAL